MDRKRRASTEVQELMNAVKSDYEFFARFDSPFQNAPSIKRQRSLSDNVLVQYAVVRPKPRYLTQGFHLSEPLNGKHSDKNIRFNEHNSLPEIIHIAPEDQRRDRSREQSQQSREQLGDSREQLGDSREQLEKSREQLGKSREQLRKTREQEVTSRDKGEQSRERLAYSPDQNEKSRKQEQLFQKIIPDFWASYGDEKSILDSPFTSEITRIRSEPKSKHDPNPGNFICLSSEPFMSRGADTIVAKKRRMGQKLLSQNPKRLPTVVEIPDEPPLLIRVDTNTAREVSENEAKNHGLSRNTKIKFCGFSVNEPLVYDPPAKIRRISEERERKIAKRPINVEKRASSSDSEEELIIVDSTPSPISCQLSDSQSPTNQKAPDNHVTSSQTNEKPEESKEILPIERKSPDGGSPIHLSLTDQIFPDYVITRVGSLLWLDKEVVYPITLDEMRRRIQDPENFSFQMLIAYVRHSRAKGRQFLDYWKCQPSGRTSRPNVLSKLCEADAKELVKGIQNVNEEYFPQEALAKNVAANIFQENGNRLTANEAEGKNAKELVVEEKVKAIEKSRSVFKILQKTLDDTQDDERFSTYNVASHNSGVENIKSSLKFLDSIFGRVQSHVQGNHKNLPALTA
ncbi:Hypothetical predicted protein [Paramuricea clavata]|nr:Hypothetical predicted protein [Paramuricea clavata]